MKPKVIVYKKMYSQVLEELREKCEIVYFEELNPDVMPLFYQELKDAVGLIGTGLKIDDTLLARAPQLKIVSNVAVGYENFDLHALTQAGVMATNTPDVLTDTVADLMMGLMLAAARRIPEMDRYVKAGQWTSHVGTPYFGWDVHHKKLGIIGMGRIGTAIAKRARLGFDMEILYHNRSRNEEVERLYQASYRSLEQLCQESDFICLMVPLSAQTTKLIGKKEFALMKKTAIFVNGSRGATVDEGALVEALQQGEILAAGLDVFVKEPIDTEHPLLDMPNVVTLPHIGSATEETRLRMAQYAKENLLAGLFGKKPPALLNEEVFLRE